jgi:very-short-patch-repair endonuclease/predicted transcriptional regulator of viral defense system
MTQLTHQRALWSLVRVQHGVITRAQLLRLGFSPDAINHRIERGRLHPVYRGVYAVGRRELSPLGRGMAAVLACGPDAVLSHESAAALWDIRRQTTSGIEVSVTSGSARRHSGIRVRRRANLGATDVTTRHGIPVTTPTCTLIDLAARVTRDELEAAINEADKRDLIDLEALRNALDSTPRRPGVAPLRRTIDRRTFTFTRSGLERHFLPIARRAGLPRPQTRVYVNEFEVDFYWHDLGLVVEADGWRYHRTPAQQAKDRRRDQTHTAAGLTPLRFTHGQVKYEPRHVEAVLTTVARRLRPAPA